MPLIGGYDVPKLCMSTVATDYPMIVTPHIIPCGPILQASKPLSEIDPELHTRISDRPTVLIVLGSLIICDESFAKTLYAACRVLLDRRRTCRCCGSFEGGDVGRSRQQVVAGLVARGRSLGSAQDGQCYLCGEPWWK